MSIQRCHCWLLALLFGGTLAAQSTIRLDDERVFERARVIGQSATTVTLSHSGGIVQVEKELLPAELRARYPLAPVPTPESRPLPAVPETPPPPPAPVVAPVASAPAHSPLTATPAAPAVSAASPQPMLLVTATYCWREPAGGATPLSEGRGFAVERATFLDWAARRRERFAAVGRRLLLEFVRAEDAIVRNAARERLEQWVAKSVGEPPAVATRLVLNEYGQFSITAPVGRAFVVVMTATHRRGGETRSMTWFDLIDGTGDRRITRDALETSVGDWSFAE